VLQRLIVVYDSPYEEFKVDFLEELEVVMTRWQGPTLIGGDFNLVRNQREKNNGVVNFNHVSLFNEWINIWDLIEVKDPVRSFSWSNNQEKPILAKLDRILASVEWDNKYPLATVSMLPKEVNDQTPLRITFGGKANLKEPMFRFEKWWLQCEDFAEVVKKSWNIECPASNPVQVWQVKIRNLRWKIKGWSRNREAEMKKKKKLESVLKLIIWM
jgi:hypothetical protein